MRYLLCVFVALAMMISCQPKQELTKSSSIEKETVIDNFPKDWIGTWEGQLKIFSNNKLTQEIFMGLVIEPVVNDSLQAHTWTIIYGEGEGRQERKYELIPKDIEKGHYITDEKNSIFLDDYYLGGALYSRFEVMGNLLTAIYRRDGDVMHFEIISGSSTPITETGGEDDIPKVSSYAIPVAQHAVLYRK